MTLHVSTVMYISVHFLLNSKKLNFALKSGRSEKNWIGKFPILKWHSYETSMFLPSNIRGPQSNQTTRAVVMVTGAFDHCHLSNFAPFHWPSSKLFSLHVSQKTQWCDDESEKWFWLNRRHSWRYLIPELNANTYLHRPLHALWIPKAFMSFFFLHCLHSIHF